METTTKPTKDVIARAKRLARAYANASRPPDKPLRRISPLWWSMYGAEWIRLAQDNKNAGA